MNPVPGVERAANDTVWERDRRAWNLPQPGKASVPARRVRPAVAEEELDWYGFQAAHFPSRGRHDLEAIHAYAAYKRFGNESQTEETR